MALPAKIVIEIKDGRIHMVSADREVDLVIVDWDDIYKDPDYHIEQITVDGPAIILEGPNEISDMFKRSTIILERKVGSELEGLGM